MAAKGYRAIGARTWVEVTADIAEEREDRLCYLGETMDKARADVDELSQRRGRRPGRPTIPPITACEGDTNDA
jgi:hypothetical protein